MFEGNSRMFQNMSTTQDNHIKLNVVTLLHPQLPLIYGGIIHQNHQWRIEGNQGKESKVDLNTWGGRKNKKNSYFKDNKIVRSYCVII